MRLRFTLLALTVILSCAWTTSVVSGQEKDTKTTKSRKKTGTQSSSDTSSAATAAPSKNAPANSAGVSAADIAKAQGSGMVWVNTGSGVYHKSGRYYGKTKEGKFLSEADAKKAGYRESKDEIGTKK